eukprot:10019470-Lingulodinium_polyedra.AAC.1
MSSAGSSLPGSGSSMYAEPKQAHGTIRATALEPVDTPSHQRCDIVPRVSGSSDAKRAGSHC